VSNYCEIQSENGHVNAFNSVGQCPLCGVRYADPLCVRLFVALMTPAVCSHRSEMRNLLTERERRVRRGAGAAAELHAHCSRETGG
jgi:hypothetical protein